MRLSSDENWPNKMGCLGMFLLRASAYEGEGIRQSRMYSVRRTVSESEKNKKAKKRRGLEWNAARGQKWNTGGRLQRVLLEQPVRGELSESY